MPARLVKVSRGIYRVRWRDGTKDPKTRRYIERSTGFLTKEQALAEKRRLDAEQVKRRHLKRARDGRLLGLVAILQLWKTAALRDGRVRATYAIEKEQVLTSLFTMRGWQTVIDITPDAIDRWLDKPHEAAEPGQGTAKPLQMLKTLLRYAAGALRQPVDPLVLTTQKRYRPPRPQPPLLREHELDWLLALAQVRGGDEPYWLLEHLATYGCRPIDLCRLQLRDFDAAAGTLTLRDTKNGDTVTHPLLPQHVQRYSEHQAGRYSQGAKPTDAFFRNPWGEPWKTTRVNRMTRREVDTGKAGQLVDWYTANVSEPLMPPDQRGIYLLKDYAISRMDARGIDDRTKALFTGHRTLAVFARYKATNQDRAREALRRLESAQR